MTRQAHAMAPSRPPIKASIPRIPWLKQKGTDEKKPTSKGRFLPWANSAYLAAEAAAAAAVAAASAAALAASTATAAASTAAEAASAGAAAEASAAGASADAAGAATSAGAGAGAEAASTGAATGAGAGAGSSFLPQAASAAAAITAARTRDLFIAVFLRWEGQIHEMPRRPHMHVAAGLAESRRNAT